MDKQTALQQKMAQMKTLDFDIEEKVFDKKERSVKHFISKEVVDRGKDIVKTGSIDDAEYRKNPIVLFNHNPFMPVARNSWLKTEGDGTLVKTIFGTTPDADDIYLLNVERILNAWSIGFMPKTWEFDQESEVTTFTNIELYEYSSVAVPMNQDAVTEGLKMVKSQQVKDILTKEKAVIDNKEMFDEIDEKIVYLYKVYKEISEELKTLKDYNIEGLMNDLSELENKILTMTQIKKAGTSDVKRVFDEILEGH